ncbi:MAG TPA: PQQ-binding-like beta-propeller repeat protein, partial [Vicinamibacteria bacterium]|nr:PQQ-binding-like beta-propeller repeat protein [Vicinamibacteria bacterium]
MPRLLPVFLIVAGAASLSAKDNASKGEWHYFGADRAFTRYSPLDQIGPENVSKLTVLWRRPSVPATLKETYPELKVSGNFRSTPIFVDGVLYAPNGVGLLTAIHPGTGETIWEQEPFARTIDEAAGQSPRGIDIWRDGDHLRLILTRGEYLYAVDAKTGKLVPGFGEGGRASLHWEPTLAGLYNWTAGPIVVSDVVVVAGITGGAGDGGVKREATPEDVRGFDVRTGRLLWTFHVVPPPGEEGNDTWGEESWKFSGDLGSWCCVSADEELGYVYIPLSAPTAAYYGGHRPGDNLYSNSLVALEAKTGKKVWHFQMVHHDVWEYDTVGPATLGDITVNGKRIHAVMQPSKTAFLYVFDRKTGEPVWPIEERPVPVSEISSENLSPTQPFPSKPAAFDRQGFTEEDLIDFTPELAQKAREIASTLVLGPMFTPPSLKSTEPGGKQGTIANPGWWGAGNWNTGAFDPETGVYYAVSHTWPAVYHLSKPTEADATLDYAVTGEQEDDYPLIDGIPIVKPPYGRITAIDMNRGEHLWMAANGDGPRHHPLLKDLNLPPLGVPGRGAPLVTKTLLFVGEGGDAIPGIREGMWGPKF